MLLCFVCETGVEVLGGGSGQKSKTRSKILQLVLVVAAVDGGLVKGFQAMAHATGLRAVLAHVVGISLALSALSPRRAVGLLVGADERANPARDGALDVHIIRVEFALVSELVDGTRRRVAIRAGAGSQVLAARRKAAAKGASLENKAVGVAIALKSPARTTIKGVERLRPTDATRDWAVEIHEQRV